MQIIPGFDSEFEQCRKEAILCQFEVYGKPAVVCGETITAICKEEYVKEDEFGVAVNDVLRQIWWLKDDMPNARAGSDVIVDNHRYTIKNGFPIDLQDCRLMAELKFCGNC